MSSRNIRCVWVGHSYPTTVGRRWEADSVGRGLTESRVRAKDNSERKGKQQGNGDDNSNCNIKYKLQQRRTRVSVPHIPHLGMIHSAEKAAEVAGQGD